jgi:hypothetical protein
VYVGRDLHVRIGLLKRFLQSYGSVSHTIIEFAEENTGFHAGVVDMARTNPQRDDIAQPSKHVFRTQCLAELDRGFDTV